MKKSIRDSVRKIVEGISTFGKKLFLSLGNFFHPKQKGEFLPRSKNSGEYAIELYNVDKYVIDSDGNQEKILSDINLKIKRSSFVVINGESGAGKTTLLNVMARMKGINNGAIFIEGVNTTGGTLGSVNLSHIYKSISFVFQDYLLLNGITVRENLEVSKVFFDKDMEIEEDERWMDVEQILKFVDIYDVKDKYPNEVSGGQQQRTALARALVRKPKTIFCDEPTAALHDEMAQKIINLLRRINKIFGITVVISTHDSSLLKIADHIINIKKGKIDSEQLVVKSS